MLEFLFECCGCCSCCSGVVRVVRGVVRVVRGVVRVVRGVVRVVRGARGGVSLVGGVPSSARKTIEVIGELSRYDVVDCVAVYGRGERRRVLLV